MSQTLDNIANARDLAEKGYVIAVDGGDEFRNGDLYGVKDHDGYGRVFIRDHPGQWNAKRFKPAPRYEDLFAELQQLKKEKASLTDPAPLTPQALELMWFSEQKIGDTIYWSRSISNSIWVQWRSDGVFRICGDDWPLTITTTVKLMSLLAALGCEGKGE